MGNVIIKKPYYYAIKVDATSGRQKKTMYKVGETHTNSKRPDALVNKYEKLRATVARIVMFEELPVRNNKRIRDTQIHAELIKTGKFTRVDEFTVIGAVGDDDGKHEFFETSLTETEVINTIKKIVESLTRNAINFRYKVATYNNYCLHFTQKHLVSGKLFKTIRDHFPIATRLMYTPGNTIVLIGQFCPESIATFAMINKVIVWHDSADQKYIYKEDEELNDRITYIETMEELINLNLSFDLIIANPPYGSVGADIAKVLIDNVDYDEFICLLPANDYVRDVNKALYRHVELDSMRAVGLGFSDTAVTTHIARILKLPNSNISLDSFEITNYADPQMTKYFYKNRVRNHDAIDKANSWLFYNNCDNLTDVVLPHKFVWGKVYYAQLDSFVREKRLSTKRAGVEYDWNHRTIDSNWLVQQNLCPSTPGKINKYIIKFGSSIEKDNFVNFIYSKDGFRFIGKILMALNSDSTVKLCKWVPKVDWTRAWTVEEILADYGYTQKEIEEVMADLPNFKGMEA